MVRRTTMNLDHDLLIQARDALGARTATEAVHTALAQVVRRERLKGLASMNLEDLSLEEFRALRDYE
jgi:Arc/MetJ family transcription regulator